LHVIHGRTVRFATTPAALGRDPLAEVPLRDPGVSRRHALLTVATDAITLADTGSRLGTFVAGARLSDAAELGGDTEATLGPSCRLSFGRLGEGDHVLIRGDGGLDAGMMALVGRGRLPIGALIPGADGAWLEIDAAGVHLGHPPGLAVRLGGHPAASRIDLLHGDRIDLGDDVTIEVP
jgi:hypothetical protein